MNRFLKCFRHLYYGKKEKKKAGYGPIKKAMFAPSIWLGQGEKAIKTTYLPLLWLGIGHKRFVFFVVSISQSRFAVDSIPVLSSFVSNIYTEIENVHLYSTFW